MDGFLATGLPFLDTAERPPLAEYVLRRDILAKALVADGVYAFVAEPGYTFSYHANITQEQWEPWEAEERPFFMIVRSQKSLSGEIIANTFFFVPHFEEERAGLLEMPFEQDISTIIYKEHWDYWSTLYTSEIWGDTLSPKIMVDEEIRDVIQRGISNPLVVLRSPASVVKEKLCDKSSRSAKSRS